VTVTSGPLGPHLVRTDENVDEIDALAARLGGRAGLAAVLGDLNRRARRTWAPGLAVRRALTWDRADRRDPDWWPQGISTSTDAEAPAPTLVVSWYAQHGQGSRLTFLDLRTRRYRHVLLVRPVVEDGVATLKPLKVHAGGLVWHGPYVHVAATARGVYTCRVDDILRLPSAGLVESYGHRYVLPVRFGYRAVTDEGTEALRYSFLSLDRSRTPPELVVGEYGNRRQTRRLARFPVDPTTMFLAEEAGVSRPLALDEGGVVRAQGAAIARGRWYVTASHGPRMPGSVYVGQPGAFREHRWAAPMGPEDIAWDADTDLLWSVTEHPRRRWVYAMKRSSFD
jgi:hypothetical protein